MARTGKKGADATPGDGGTGVAPVPLRIFINYRRGDSSGYAGRLYDALAERSHGWQVFMDIDAIEPGADFTEVIDRELESCDVVIAVIGKHWLEETDANGRRRLDNPNDFVRLEIGHALDRNIRVIPTLVQGAEMPGSDQLPEPLEGLSRRNALELSDGRWRYDIDRLAQLLEHIQQQAVEVQAAQQETVQTVEPERPRPVPKPPARELPKSEATEAAAPRGVSGRRWIWLVAGLAVVGAAGAAVSVLALGGGSKAAKKISTTTPPLRVEPEAPLERASIAASGSSIYLTSPGGSIVRLADDSLKTEARAGDPAGPRAVASVGSTVYIADDETLTRRRSDTLAPLESVSFPHSLALAGVANSAAVAATRATSGDRGQVCIARGGALEQCGKIGFVPSGLGVAPGPVIVVSNAASGTVVPYRRQGGTLVAAPEISVGPKPHGNLLAFSGKLYVPIQRGVAVVDLGTLKRSGTIRLPATPANIWIVPSEGRLVAALYSQNKVAIVDTASPEDSPLLVSTGKRPVAVSGSTGAVVYVVNEGDGTVARMNALNGSILDSVKVPALAAGTVQVRAQPPTFATKGRTVVATIPLGGGVLDQGSLVIRDQSIADGRASLVAWQGGITSRAGGPKGAHGVSVSIRPAVGRLIVNVSTKPRAFETVRFSLGPGGRSIVLTLTKVRSPQISPTTTSRPTTTQPTTQPTTTQRPTSPPPTTTTQPPATQPPPPPTITVG